MTSTEYRFRARPWDLQNVASTCNMCASGCSIHVGVRVQDGNVVRFSAATNEETNEEWLCDKGRYGNAYVSGSERLTQPLVRADGELAPVGWDDAFKALADGLSSARQGAPAGVIVGESLCDEDAYVAQKFARVVLGTNNVDHRLEGGMPADALLPPRLSYDDVLGSDLAVLVSLDAREELPILFLRLRIAATKRALPIAIVHPREIELSEFARLRLQPLPGGEAALGTALLHGLTNNAAAQPSADATGIPADEIAALGRALQEATRPVILLGPHACSSDVIRVWYAVAQITGARLHWAPRRAGTYGALAAGAHPELLPGWRCLSDEKARKQLTDAWGAAVHEAPGLDVGGMLREAASGSLQALWLAGADVLADVPEAGLGARALQGAKFVVVQDVQHSALLEHADVVLPAAAFVERDGTLTDWEGRRQPIRAATDPPGAARADYAILAEAARRLGRDIGCRTQAQIASELDGLLQSSSAPAIEDAELGPIRADEGLRLLTYRLLYDDGSRIRHTDGVRELTSESFAEMHPADAERAGIEDGHSVRVSSAHGSVTTHARLSKAVRRGVVFIPWRQWGVSAQPLCAWGDTSPNVTVEPA